MLLDVSQAIRAEGQSFFFHQEEQIDPQDIHGERVSFDTPVLMEGSYRFEDDCLRMTGTLTATAHSRCCNCLQDATVHLSVPFDEIFRRVSRYEEPTDPFESDQWTFEGSRIDTSHVALTIALLDLPIRFLCKPDCEGYRKYLPEQKSSGEAEEHLNPFYALKDLLREETGG